MHRRLICQTLLATVQQVGQVRQSDPLDPVEPVPIGITLPLRVGSESDPENPDEPHDPIGDDPHPEKFKRIVATNSVGQLSPGHPATLVRKPQPQEPDPLLPLDPDPEQQSQFG